MHNARSRPPVAIDSGHVAPDHAVRPRDELRFDFGE
jgi:hypothetical protein